MFLNRFWPYVWIEHTRGYVGSVSESSKNMVKPKRRQAVQRTAVHALWNQMEPEQRTTISRGVPPTFLRGPNSDPALHIALSKVKAQFPPGVAGHAEIERPHKEIFRSLAIRYVPRAAAGGDSSQTPGEANDHRLHTPSGTHLLTYLACRVESMGSHIIFVVCQTA